ELLILDEPTSALDPLVRKSLFAELRSVTQQGRTVLFSSHSLNEVESLCDEVIVLRSGKVVEQQSIEALRGRALRKIQIRFDAGKPDLQVIPPTQMKVFHNENGDLAGTWPGDIKPLLRWIDQQPIEDVIIERPDLNDLFMSYYTELKSDPND
ncbi:MAG: AAA family ATPase, partial [Planctomycetota bacterium]